MKKFVIAAAIAAVVVPVGAAEAKKKPEMSALELQQLQSRELDATKDQVFGAVMSVLQDSGYRIQAADKDTGLITGLASTKSHFSYNLWSGFGKSKKTPIVSAYIEQITPTTTRVRLSFVMGKIKSSIYGSGPEDEEPIYDPTVYQKAFEQVNQALFVRQGMQAEAPSAAPAGAMGQSAPTPTPVANRAEAASAPAVPAAASSPQN